ncbi:MAG: superoxide dismutase family protein [Bdellovibrionales bacterium]|nr:superoxide dismutase family protein [Bdellovibrionales bacterium]
MKLLPSHKLLILLSITLPLLFNISCAHHKYKKKYKKAGLAVLSPVNNSKVKGWVHFHKIERKKVLVRAKVTGLEPNKKYGFHIHQYGDCREDGKNAGGHLSYRKNSKHGAPDSEKKHIGDLGNLVTGKTGTATYQNILDICMYKTGGRSVIVHANEDDLKSQPSGNSGSYIGCGVIGYVKSADQEKGVSKVTKEKAKATKMEKETPKAKGTTKTKEKTKAIETKKGELKTKEETKTKETEEKAPKVKETIKTKEKAKATKMKKEAPKAKEKAKATKMKKEAPKAKEKPKQ